MWQAGCRGSWHNWHNLKDIEGHGNGHGNGHADAMKWLCPPGRNGYECFTQVYEAYKSNLMKGFTIRQRWSAYISDQIQLAPFVSQVINLTWLKSQKSHFQLVRGVPFMAIVNQLFLSPWGTTLRIIQLWKVWSSAMSLIWRWEKTWQNWAGPFFIPLKPEVMAVVLVFGSKR